MRDSGEIRWRIEIPESLNSLSITMNFCFAVDKTLGTLAKWLRILGYDTIYESEASGKEFYTRLEDDRILITRSKKIEKTWASHRLLFITSSLLDEQLKQVVGQLGIDRDDIRPFSICIHCNLSIDEVKKRDVYGLVPDYIWQTHDAFKRCRQCQRIYWAGSHAERSMERIERLFKNG